MMVGATILNANDLELVGKNVLKNSNDIEMIKKELKYYLKGLKLAETTKDTIQIADIQNNIGYRISKDMEPIEWLNSSR